LQKSASFGKALAQQLMLVISKLTHEALSLLQKIFCCNFLAIHFRHTLLLIKMSCCWSFQLFAVNYCIFLIF